MEEKEKKVQGQTEQSVANDDDILSTELLTVVADILPTYRSFLSILQRNVMYC